MYSKTTKGITVTVTPHFMEDETNLEQLRFVWAYHVRIENEGNEKFKLISRKWIITDAHGGVQEIVGEGIIGEQPVLEPGDSYEYTSGVPLCTPSGFMRGYYYMTNDFDETIEVEIPNFSLDSPYESTSIH
jgi:ApaG protein